MRVGADFPMGYGRIFFGRITVAVATAMVLLCALNFAAFAASVLVEGNKRVDSETIAGYFTGSDQASINKGVKELYATGLFSSVKVGHAGGSVVITVIENNVINRVVFEGNSKVKSDTLTAEIQSKSRGPYSQAMVDADVERIKDVYRRILWHLRPPSEVDDPAGEKLILVAHEASVMDLFSVDLDRLAAVIIEHGGPQSHAAILARGLGQPIQRVRCRAPRAPSAGWRARPHRASAELPRQRDHLHQLRQRK